MLRSRCLRVVCLLLIVVGAPLLAEEPFAGPGPWMVRAWFGDEAMIRAVASWGDHFGDYSAKGFLLLEADARRVSELQALGFFVELDAERTGWLRLAEAPLAPGEWPGAIPNFPCYRTVEETYASAQALVIAYPDLATLTDIGNSWEKENLPGAGYDLLALVLTNTNTPGPKPVLLVTAAIHAREYTTAELAIRFAEGLLADYGSDADASWLLDGHEIHLVLHTNPDGRKHAESGESWRKNTNQNYCGATSVNRGADLNRNFDFYWSGWPECPPDIGSSGLPCSATFRGAAAASEPEVQAVQSYMAQVLLDQRDPDDLTTPAPLTTTGIYVDLHSYNPAILSPWGHSNQPDCTSPPQPPNGEGILRLGRKWGFLSGWDPRIGSLYVVDGSTKDYAYGRFGVPAYTWEMGSAFFESCASFEVNVLPAGLAMLRYAAKVARTPYLTPAGPDNVGLVATPAGLFAGESLAVSATVDDTRYYDANGSEPSQAIQAARAFVDTPPWQVGAMPLLLAATDGAFDETVEQVAGTLDTSALGFGRHTVYLEGEDASGAKGAISAAHFWIIDPASAPTLDGLVLEAGNGTPLAATVSAGSFSTATDPATGAYSLRLPAGTYTLTATSPGHAAQSVANVVAIDDQTTTTDFALPYLLTRFADDGEHGNLGWTAQSPWALSTEAAASPTHAWSDSPGGNYGNGVNTSLTSPTWDLTGLENVTLSWRQIYDLETGWDYGRVEVSTNGGSSWSEVRSVNGEGHDTAWESVTLAVPALDGAAQARLRFRLTSDGSQVFDGWHVDDILLSATSPYLVFADGFDLSGTDRWSGVQP